MKTVHRISFESREPIQSWPFQVLDEQVTETGVSFFWSKFSPGHGDDERLQMSFRVGRPVEVLDS